MGKAAAEEDGRSKRHNQDEAGVTADAISEWIKLGQLVLVQVHGSCEDERVFSAMAYLKNKHCHCVAADHEPVRLRTIVPIDVDYWHVVL